jgi:LysM repeat protein
MPFTDEFIKEIYVLSIEAYGVGQARIPVHIFPIKMDGATFNPLANSYADDADRVRFWNNIKTGYDYFNLTKRLPNIEMGASGLYHFKDGDIPVVGNSAPILVGSLNGGAAPPVSTGSGAVADMPKIAENIPTLPNLPKDGYHIVQAGETLYGLGKKYRHSVYVLRKWNELSGNIIEVGQALRITPPANPPANHHEVKRGDTLYSIAQKYGLSVKSLKSMNNKTSDVLKVDEKLLVKNP